MNETATKLQALWTALDKSHRFINPKIDWQLGSFQCTTTSPNCKFLLGSTAQEAVRKIREIHGYKNL